ncbi:MAG TPA: hypothetical protein VGS27_00815 [Candidatus Sulfotelmatobacter sp.]|nr:hypothetical protein [Candidatus Sulfotelmatobacter sp.]
MGKIKVILGVLFFALFMTIAWQFASCEFANYLLKDDLKDVAAMGGSKIGLLKPLSDTELRQAVIHKAAEHGIRLMPEQIFVHRSGTTEDPVIFLATKYRARVSMPGVSLVLHLTATSR